MKKKKKIVIGTLLAIIFLVIIGRVLFSGVNQMDNWSFQYNSGTEDYSFFFRFCNKNGKSVAVPCKVTMKIENENGDVVYEGTKEVERRDFGMYSSQARGEHLLANVRFKSDEIAEGNTANGTIYFTVEGKNFLFDETRCEVDDLPTKSIAIKVQDLPVTVCRQDSWSGARESELLITDVQCQIEEGLTPSASITVSGEKTYGSQDDIGVEMIGYQLCNHEGYVVDTGQILISKSLGVGDKFKDDSLTLYDLVPGEEYTLTLKDVH